MDNNYVCQPCAATCKICTSSSYCSRAADGYFISIWSSYTGKVEPCQSPCATCMEHKDNCLSCVPGFTLMGGICMQDSHIIIKVVFGPGSGVNPIFTALDSITTQIFNCIMSINRIGNMLDAISPAGFKAHGFSGWQSTRTITNLTSGSVQATVQQNAGSYQTSA